MELPSREPVCLITPPSVFLLNERIFPSLGILKVAAALEQAGHDVEMLDLSGVPDYAAAVQSFLLTSNCRTFGITATTPQIPQTMEIAAQIRNGRPGAKIILGGPHVTLVHTAMEREQRRGISGRATKALESLHAAFDILVSGDGEKSIFEALRENAPKLINANDLHSPLFMTSGDYFASPFPARHLIDLASYRYSIDGVPATSIIGQIGCPFACTFCGGRESPCMRMVRTRPPETIAREIETIYQTYGFTGYMFYDDELNANPRLMELLDRLISLQIRTGKRFHLHGFVKAELFNESQAKAMLQAGFRWIVSGFESGSPRMLANMNTRATREDNSRCIAIARKHGLRVKALMSIGHPGESLRTIAETRDWLLENRPDDFDLTVIAPYPGTAYYDRAVPAMEQQGLWVYAVPGTGDKLYSTETDSASTAVHYKGDTRNDCRPRAYTATDHLTSRDLVKARGELEHELRTGLSIPYTTSVDALYYEHSIGQSGDLTGSMLKATQVALVA